MNNDKWKSGQEQQTAICHFSLVIGHRSFFLCAMGDSAVNEFGCGYAAL
jgi:hypothetical protein